MPRGILVHSCTCVLLPFTIFSYFICFYDFFKEVVNYKGCMDEGRGISAYSKTCSRHSGIFCMCCSMPKQMACGTHSIFLCIQVHFPDVERVEWLNKVRSSELQLLRPSALSCTTAQTLRAKSEKVIKSLQYISILSESVLKS